MTRQLRTSFTVNGNACPDRDRLVAWVASARPTTILVMDGHELAVDLWNASNHETMVCHRQWNPGEGGEWEYTTPKDYVADLIKWGHPEILRQVLNEPAISTEKLPFLLYWLMGVMDELHAHGYRGVIGNFPMGQITQQHVESGVFDDLLRHYDYYRKIAPGRFYIGEHEYTAITRYFGVGMWPMLAPTPKDYFLSPANHARELWPTKDALPVARFGADLPPYWHVRRADWLTIRAREIGIPDDPQYWVTESGYDSMPDVGEVFPALTDKWGIAGNYDNLRGFNSLANVWAAYWPDWNFDEAAFEQERWLHEECYPSNYIGWNNFMWTSDHWRRDGFDMSQNLQFQALLVDYAIALRTEQPPVPDPEPDPEPEPDELPYPLWKAVLIGILLFIICLVGTLGAFFLASHLKTTGAQSAGGYPMTMNDLLTQLFAIPAFAVVSYTAGIVWFLVEIWKRYIVARLPERVQASPETVALLLIGLFMAVHGLAVQYEYDNALKEVAQFITDLVNVLGPYVLGGVATSAVTNYTYNKLRGQNAPGFNAVNPTKK